MRRSRSHRVQRAPGVAIVALIVVTLGTLGTPAAAQDGDEGEADGSTSIDVDALREEYEELAGAEGELLVQYDLSGARLAELVVEVADATEAVARADAAAVAAELDLAAREEEEKTVNAQAAAATARVRRAEDELRSFAVETYMDIGDAATLGSILDVVDGDDGALARTGYRRTVSNQQDALIDALIEARTQATIALDRAQAAAADAREQRRRVEELRSAAGEALESSRSLVEEVEAERASQELLITQIRSKKVAIEARIISLEKAGDGIAALLAAFQLGDEDYVDGAVDVRIPRKGGVISSEFGMRFHPILNVSRLHAGADIGAPAGSPVLAAADGVVLAAEVRGGYGKAVVLAHGHSVGTVYGHNSSLEVQVGQLVEQGDVIARAGSTGLSTSPHIHFETRIRGVPVNPRSILSPGDATWGKADADGDGITNGRDLDPEDPDIPVAGGAGDDDGDGRPNGVEAAGEIAPPR